MTSTTMSVRVAVARPVLVRAASYVVAVVAAFVVSGIALAAMGYDAPAALESIVTTSFKTPFGFVETLHRWVPLALQGLAFTIPLVAGKYNIGGEGQLLVGATAAAAIGIVAPNLPAVILLPLVLGFGLVAGALWAGIAAWLMNRFGINEILSTVLLNFVSFGVVDYVASEVWSDPAAGHPTTTPIGTGGQLPLFGDPPMHMGVLLAAVLVLATIVATRRTQGGFQLRAVGANARASAVNGIRVGRIVVGALVLGGAFAGLSGAIQVAGVHYVLIGGMQSNFMALGIIIGLIARGNVLLVPLVAFGISVLENGASAMQRTVGAPSEMVLIVEALILIFVLLSDVVLASQQRTLR